MTNRCHRQPGPLASSSPPTSMSLCHLPRKSRQKLKTRRPKTKVGGDDPRSTGTRSWSGTTPRGSTKFPYPWFGREPPLYSSSPRTSFTGPTTVDGHLLRPCVHRYHHLVGDRAGTENEDDGSRTLVYRGGRRHRRTYGSRTPAGRTRQSYLNSTLLVLAGGTSSPILVDTQIG